MNTPRNRSEESIRVENTSQVILAEIDARVIASAWCAERISRAANAPVYMIDPAEANDASVVLVAGGRLFVGNCDNCPVVIWETSVDD